MWLAFSYLTAYGDESDSSLKLLFDRAAINRYSLDHLPRSLSLRQGADVWLGYNLEQGKLYKAWKAPEGESGLVASGFTTKSKGTSWYSDKTEESWTYTCNGEAYPMDIRYLGCTHRQDHFELRWELKFEERRFVLQEQIPANSLGKGLAERNVQISNLVGGEAILPPAASMPVWILFDETGTSTNQIGDSKAYRWVLP
jgi:hypothetical protein